MASQKENEGATLRGSRHIDVRGSYAAKHHQYKSLAKSKGVRVSSKFDVERLLKKSTVSPAVGRPRSPAKKARSSIPNKPGLFASIATPSTLDDETQKLQEELQACDHKLQMLKSHLGPMGTPPMPASVPAVHNVSRQATPAEEEAQASSGAPAIALGAPPPRAAAALERHSQQEESIVKGVITATGQGCRDVIAAGNTTFRPGSASAPCWTTRPHKAAFAESSCMLQLMGRHHEDVTVRLTFADASSVPAIVRFEHAPKPTAAFELLGEVRLHERSLRQLKHMFRLGSSGLVERCMRVSCIGHIATENSGMHKVTQLSITGTSVHAPDASISAPMRDSVSLFTAPAATRSAAHTNKTLEGSIALQRDEEVEHTVVPVAFSAEFTAKAKKGNKVAPPPPPPLPATVTTTRGNNNNKRTPPPPPPPLPTTVGKLAALAAAPIGEEVDEMEACDGKPGRAPKGPTVKLFWDKLQLPAEGGHETLWKEIEGMESELDYSNLEEEFAVVLPQPKTVSSKPKAGTKTSTRPGAATLLSVQRANNVGVLLARLKLSAQQAERAVLHLLGELEEKSGKAKSLAELDEDALRSLMQCLPTQEEQGMLAAFTGNGSTLSQAERFMLSMVPIPKLRERLQAAIFKLQFDARVESVAGKAALLSQACHEVKTSSLLKSVFKTALLIGNFLNAGNRNGSAAGFQVDALLKLKDVKSTRVRSRSLLHFLDRELTRQHPDGASLRTALPSCRAAARLDLHAVRAELDELAAGLLMVERVITECNTPAYAERMEPFVCSGADALAAVQEQVLEADAAFLNLRTFINGLKNTMEEPCALFGVLDKFSFELDAAHAENAASDTQAAKREGAKPRPSSAPSSMGGSVDPASSAAGGKKEHEETPPLRKRDRMLATIRLYSRMTADQRKALLTEKGAVDRINKLNINHRHSTLGLPASSEASVAGSATRGKGGKEEGGLGSTISGGGVRASAPAGSLAAVLAKARTRRLNSSSLKPSVSGAQSDVGSHNVDQSQGAPQHHHHLPTVQESEAESQEPSMRDMADTAAAAVVAAHEADSTCISTMDQGDDDGMADCGASSLCNMTATTTPAGLNTVTEGPAPSAGTAHGSSAAAESTEGSGDSATPGKENEGSCMEASPAVPAEGGDKAKSLSTPVARLVESTNRLIQSLEQSTWEAAALRKSAPVLPAGAAAGVGMSAAQQESTGVCIGGATPDSGAGASSVPSTIQEESAEVVSASESEDHAEGVGGEGEGVLSPESCSSPDTAEKAPRSSSPSEKEVERQSRRSVRFAAKDDVVTLEARPEADVPMVARAAAAAAAVVPMVAAVKAAGGPNPALRSNLRQSMQSMRSAGPSAAPLSPTSTPLATFRPRRSQDSGISANAGGGAALRRSGSSGGAQYIDPRQQQQLEQYQAAMYYQQQQQEQEAMAYEEEMYYQQQQQQHVPQAMYTPHHGPAPRHSMHSSMATEACLTPTEPQYQVAASPCPMTGDSAQAVADDQSFGDEDEEEREERMQLVKEQEEQERQAMAATQQQEQQQRHRLSVSSAAAVHHPEEEEDQEPQHSSQDAMAAALKAAARGSNGQQLDLRRAAALLAAADQVRQSWHHPQRPPREGSQLDSPAHTVPARYSYAGSLPATQEGYHGDDQEHYPVLEDGGEGYPVGSSAATLEALREQAAAVLASALTNDMRRSLPNLPGVSNEEFPALPLGGPMAGGKNNPMNLDAIMAAVIANAGNTPTGPLARGVREGDEELFDDSPANALREEVARREPHKALLEPIVPAPLGMGVRASEYVARGISPQSLRHNLAMHLKPLAPGEEELIMHSRMRSRSHMQQQTRTAGTASRTTNGGTRLDVSVQGPRAPHPAGPSGIASARQSLHMPHSSRAPPPYSQQQQQQQAAGSRMSHGGMRSSGGAPSAPGPAVSRGPLGSRMAGGGGSAVSGSGFRSIGQNRQPLKASQVSHQHSQPLQHYQQQQHQQQYQSYPPQQQQYYHENEEYPEQYEEDHGYSQQVQHGVSMRRSQHSVSMPQGYGNDPRMMRASTGSHTSTGAVRQSVGETYGSMWGDI